MCEEGRFDFPYINSGQRIMRPLCREPGASTEWDAVLSSLRRDLTEAVRKDASSVAAVFSPFLTCEEAYLLAKFFKNLSGQVRLYLGWVPIVGEDEHFPKDGKGRPMEPVKFTIRAEKCPNRKGVEEILRHFQGEIMGYSDVLRAAGAGEVKALHITAGYSPVAGRWISEEQADRLKHVPLLVVQDLFGSPASTLADYVLPAASFAANDLTFVNHSGLAQAIRSA